MCQLLNAALKKENFEGVAGRLFPNIYFTRESLKVAPMANDYDAIFPGLWQSKHVPNALCWERVCCLEFLADGIVRKVAALV